MASSGWQHAPRLCHSGPSGSREPLGGNCLRFWGCVLKIQWKTGSRVMGTTGVPCGSTQPVHELWKTKPHVCNNLIFQEYGLTQTHI